MKVREFSEKYNQPYSLVYEASFETPSRKNLRKTDIPEKELFDAVKAVLDRRINMHLDQVRINQERRYKLLNM